MTPFAARQRFAEECRALLRLWWSHAPHTQPDTPSAEQAGVWATAVLGEALPPLSWHAGFLQGSWKDASGQMRGVYGRYVLACQVQACILRATAIPSVSTLCAALQEDLTQPARPLEIQLWNAWNLWLLGRAGRQAPYQIQAVHCATDLMRRHQQPAGHWRQLTAQTNLDTFNYDELVTLHALGALAAASGDAALRDGASRMAAYHCANTQPDNTTHQPWAMGVFAWFADTLPLAQQQLHTVRTGADHSGLMLALLADAVALP